MSLSEKEMARIQRMSWPSYQPINRRKKMLRARFKGRYHEEIVRTKGKLRLLREIIREVERD